MKWEGTLQQGEGFDLTAVLQDIRSHFGLIGFDDHRHVTKRHANQFVNFVISMVIYLSHKLQKDGPLV